MEMKYILYSKVHKTTDAGETWTFKFQSVEPDFKKHCSFSVTSEDPFDIMGKFDLPQGIGDIVIIDVSKKNVQGNLIPRDMDGEAARKDAIKKAAKHSKSGDKKAVE